VDKNFKSSAYLAWNSEDFSGNSSCSAGIEPLFPRRKSADGKRKTYRKVYRGSFSSTLDYSQSSSDADMDTTMISANIAGSSHDNDTTAINNPNNDISLKDALGSTYNIPNNNVGIEEMFPVPEVMIKDLFDLYKGKRIKERDLALLNYVKLLFNRLN